MAVLKANVGGVWVPITSVGSGAALLPGGTTDQVLAKKSDVDYDTKWATLTPPDLSPYIRRTGDTMTGPLTIQYSGQALVLQDDQAYIAWFNGGTRRGYVQGHANGLTIANDTGELYVSGANGRAQFGNMAVGSIPAYGGWTGLSYPSGNYLIMHDGSSTLISSNGGAVSLRGAVNSSYQLNINGNGWHDMTGHLNMMGHMVHNAGVVQCSTVRTGGNYMITTDADQDSGLHSWGDGNIGLVVNGNTPLQVSGNTVTTQYINTNNGYRITSNGSYNYFWANAAVIAVGNVGGEARTQYSLNTSGYMANQLGQTTGGGIGCWDANANYQTFSAYLNEVSSKKHKQEIKPWPAKSVGSAVMGAASRLSLIDVVQFQYNNPPLNEQGTPHVCDDELCDGTTEQPCSVIVDWQNPRIGVLIEDLATVLPEAVGLTADNKFEGMRVGTMVGYLLAVCKEQQERLEDQQDRILALEATHQEAA